MFSIAILIGIYSYIIFTLGILGLLYKNNIYLISVLFFTLIIVRYKQNIFYAVRNFKIRLDFKKNKFFTFFFLLFIVQVSVNSIGVFGPELSFDALWYHLTLPKLYLINHSITHIPGGLLYYSDMPKLTEMIYTASLAFSNEILAKFVHFSFGILTCIALYLLAKKLFDKKVAIVGVAIFYSNLVVGWQSTTAYIDLSRTFFELMALWGFMNFWERGEKKWLIESGVMLGLAISAKLLSMISISIFVPLIFYYYIYHGKKTKKLFLSIITFISLALIVPLPWFIFSFIHTGSPVYPFFSSIYSIVLGNNIFNPIHFVKEMWAFFTNLPDRISLLYIIFLPFVFIHFRKFNPLLKIVSIYSVLAIILWYFTPRTGGGRFILPYLPAFSIIAAGIIKEFKKNKHLYKFSIMLVFFAMLLSIGYRGYANAKYLSVILGGESKANFLTKHLNFSFGDFYDTDSYFKNNIKQTDTVLLYGFHNLYYVDFPFIDSSWIKKGDTFNYIATQNTELPKQFHFWNLIYKNPKTHVNLYSLEGQKWVY
ncbi:glycosyltransferase family 39 protein [Patescibacteria group bacterium]|nr:glycosyltransferase family 39 protein [Patescibacteria group bacterium]